MRPNTALIGLLWCTCRVLVGCGADAGVGAAIDVSPDMPRIAIGAGPRPSASAATTSPTSSSRSGTSTSSTSAYGPAGEAGCSYGVTGAVEAWIDPGTSWAWVWEGGSLQCVGSTAGIEHQLTLSLDGLDGPGRYASAGDGQYSRQWCSEANTDCQGDSFDAPKQTVSCEVDITTATTNASKVAGTFSCTSLVDPTNPDRAVAIYDGTFWGEVSPPPD
jgi:hypothetical protein